MRVVEVKESVRACLKKLVIDWYPAALDPSCGGSNYVLCIVLHGSVIAMTRDSNQIVQISGEAGLRTAQETAEHLRQALAGSDSISIATEAITGADITTIQLLLAARKQALATGKVLTLTAPASGVLRALLIETGCLSADGHPLTPEGEFWTQPTRQSEPA